MLDLMQNKDAPILLKYQLKLLYSFFLLLFKLYRVFKVSVSIL